MTNFGCESRLILLNVLFTASVIVCPWAVAQVTPSFSVRDHGAMGDGLALDTAAVQAALDACADAGGGTVHFPPGKYRCGTVRLRDGVALEIAQGATLLGSADVADYAPYETIDYKNDADAETTYMQHALLFGDGVTDVAITGEGIIDANWTKRHGPKPIALKRCRDVHIADIRILNAPNYAISLLGTDDVLIDGVTILNAFADGIDPDCSRNVRIANCYIDSSDDAIVLKSSFALGERRSTEDIVITNCILRTHAHAFKTGTESGGDFKRITVSNCVMTGRADLYPAACGIAIESVDGAAVDEVTIDNIVMKGVRSPIFVRLGNRGRDMDTPVPGSMRNISINNIVATGASMTSSVTGIPGHPVEGVTLSNIRITYFAGSPFFPSDGEVPEKIEAYPTPSMFDAVIAPYGLYCRHVNDLALDNVRLFAAKDFVRITTTDRRTIQWETPDGIPQPSEPGNPSHALLCDDVDGLTLSGFAGTASTGDESFIKLKNVSNALITGSVAPQGTPAYLEVAGGESNRIALMSSDLRAAATVLRISTGASGEAVGITGCLTP